MLSFGPAAAVVSCRVVLLVVLLAGSVAVAGAATDRLVYSLTDAPADGVADWQVGFAASTSETAWRSLISEGPELRSRHLSLTLDGVSAWTLLSAEAGQRRWQSADGAWHLELGLEPGASDYRSRLSVALTALRDAPDGRRLTFRLGPGIGETPQRGLGVATSIYSFTRPSVSRDGSIVDVDADANDQALAIAEGDWAGLHSRYFALLASPRSAGTTAELAFGRAEGRDGLPAAYLPWVDFHLPVRPLRLGERQAWDYELFSGPKTRDALAGAEGQGDYSRLLFQGLWDWMRGLALALLWVLTALHGVVGSWGVAICVLAVLVRLVLYPLGRWALSSQQRFAEVQAEIAPRILEIKQNYKGGEQSERILQLYERHGVSPLAGLKPLLIVLIQIPVFVALFHVLGQVFEFRNASFLWIDSLAEPDRLFAFGASLPFFGAWFNLLPVLMAVSTLASIRLSPAPASSPAEKRRQNLFLWLMAIGFFLLFYPFPSGMVLYWILANLLYIVQFQLSKRRRTGRDRKETA